jgi:regulator of protease activity HflC (stomatin/prohibitin superfamily)
MKFVLEKEKLEAERKRIEAQGISDFQNIVSKGISEQLLQWKGIEATEKLAQSANSKVVVIGSGKNGLPLILNSD